jgi:hypothetical protein
MKTIEEEFPPEGHWITDHQLTAAYTRLRSRAVEMERALQWRPIDEAPKDLTRVDIWGFTPDDKRPRRFADCEREEGMGWWCDSLRRYVSDKNATHFRPLPPAPDTHQP